KTVTNDSICFYLHGELMVDSIIINDKQIEFDQDKVFYYYSYSLIANEIQFDLPDDLENKKIEIYYIGKFNRSESRCLSDYMRIESDGVFLRSYGYSLWLPTFLNDQTQSYTVDVPKATFRYPSDFECVFAGNRVKRYLDNNSTVSIWSAEDIDIRDLQCTVQRFGIITENWLNVFHWNDSISTSKAQEILEFTRWFNINCDKKYKKDALPEQFYIVEMPKFGDIASDNMVGISDRLWRVFGENPHAISTIAHEIVHSYVHLPVNRDDPLYAFVWEGFPSYFDDLLLDEYLDKNWLQEKLKDVEQSYLKKKKTGLDRRGRTLPKDKPLDQITANEIGDYKDQFILTSRTSLFFNYIKVKMGEKNYSAFERELFDMQNFSSNLFRKLVLEYLPDYENDIDIWLSTTDYPDRFYLENL
ncbi:MAG: hypothetical protein GY865_13310, partial [candidate division Zixibacteria bacterium]|nr:hypothetical protein [candidate division Zixibacteria bacterium]